MSLKGSLEFEPHRMQKLLLGDSPTKDKCATPIGLGCSRSKTPINRVGNKKKSIEINRSVHNSGIARKENSKYK